MKNTQETKVELELKAIIAAENGNLFGHETVYRGFTMYELKAAFELVEDPTNWKNPIKDARIPESMRSVVEAAVIFFAGCQPTFTLYPKGASSNGTTSTLLVNAVGYYSAVGA